MDGARGRPVGRDATCWALKHFNFLFPLTLPAALNVYTLATFVQMLRFF